MRTRLTRRTVFLAGLGVAAAAAALAAGSAQALNPQPLPPKMIGIVRDACTGLPIAGATVSLMPLTGERQPGPSSTGPLGGFSCRR